MSKLHNEKLPSNIPMKMQVPFFIVSADSIFFLETRTKELHENFVDGVSYELENN